MKKITCLLLSLWTVIIMAALFSKNSEARDSGGVREAVFAGSWYEGSREGLASQVDRFLTGVPEGIKLPGPVRGIVSPHAGYVYSGQTAAFAYRLLQGSGVNRVIVLAPSHRMPFHGASIAAVDYYETPLGRIPLARQICDKLTGHALIQSIPGAHSDEHSLEIQLPFLQQVLGEFRLVPLVIGNLSAGECAGLADALRPFMDEKTVVVASSDFTHYGEGFGYVPFKDPVKENLKKLDYGAFDRITALDPQGFLEYVEETGATICGRLPIAVLLHMFNKKHYEAKLLEYETSGNLTGDYSHTVSYGAIAIYSSNGGRQAKNSSRQEKGNEKSAEKDQKGKAGSEMSADRPLNLEEQAFLLELARQTLQAHLSGEKIPAPKKKNLPSTVLNPMGAFVTLKSNGMLRGCIGYVEARKSLYETVIDNAINAGTRDPRFDPMTADELEKVKIEISAMSPLKKIDDISEIQVGKHGLIIRKGYHSGLLLPQVATEYNWDRDTFLQQTCLKAGLKKDAWKSDNADIYIFSAQVFHEE